MLLLGLACLTPGQASAQAVLGNEDGCDGDFAYALFACGSGGSAAGSAATAIQGSAVYSSTAVGYGSHAGGPGPDKSSAVAVGSYANASGARSIAIGGLRIVDGQTTIDDRTQANGDDSIAIGASAAATNARSIAIGTNASAAQDGVALGHNASAHTNSVAIGSEVSTDRDNQVKIGRSATTYTLTGIASDNSRDMQSGRTYMVTTDANGNLATSTFNLATLEALPGQVTSLQTTVNNHQTTLSQHTTTLNQHSVRITNVENKNVEQDGRLDQHDTQITSLFSLTSEHTNAILDLDGRVTTNTQAIAAIDNRVTGLADRMDKGFARLDGRINQAFEGAAMAMAMAAPAMPYDKNYAVSINWGNFEGKNAFAGTAQARVSESFVVHGGIGLGSAGTVGGRAGLTFAW